MSKGELFHIVEKMAIGVSEIIGRQNRSAFGIVQRHSIQVHGTKARKELG